MTPGLLVTSFALGLRHGVDWDHIAAIADLSGTAVDRRRGFVLSMLYAVGHAAVVFALGVLAIVFGMSIPDGADDVMGRIVGVTLIALGLWIIVDLLRKGRSFRLRSRWMLVLSGTFAGLRRVRRGLSGRRISVEHEHRHEHDDPPHDAAYAHDHAHVDAVAERVFAEVVTGPRTVRPLRAGSAAHSHRHRHDLALPDVATARYGNGTAAGVGMLHGIGLESPTQIAIFVASTSVGGAGLGMLLLAAWVVGLVVANAGLATVAAAGVLRPEHSFSAYATIAVILAVLSIGMGTLYLVGLDVLPALN
ncbi:MAG: hypothetical protein HKO87_02735 [Acidimicrobiia bacterium]|nr:hypothetical protein [Acidimicrobiia bacterium]